MVFSMAIFTLYTCFASPNKTIGLVDLFSLMHYAAVAFFPKLVR